MAANQFATQVIKHMLAANRANSSMYARGFALWKELDETKLKATKGESSLDDHLALLTLNRPFRGHDKLHPEFATTMRAVIGQPDFDEIVSRHF